MRTPLLLAAVLLLSGCAPGGPPDVGFGAGGGASDAAPPDTAWRHLATTEGMLDGNVTAAAVESADGLAAAWDEYRLPEGAPEVDFDRRFVLLLGQPDDACVDELTRLEVEEGSLQVEWLSPPGACPQPLVFRIHAVEVDRRHVPERFEVAFPEPFETEADPVTIEVATAEGDAPPPPEPPDSMTEEELEAVFAGHSVRRCTAADEPLPPEAHGDPIDDTEEYTEAPEEQQALDLVDDVRRWLRSNGYRDQVDYIPFIDRREGVRPGLWVDNGAAAKVQRELDAAFGRGTVHVEDHAYDFEAVQQAQDDLMPLMGDDGPGNIVSSSGLPGPVRIGMVDPTREALDQIAAAVDVSVVCVDPELSGVGAEAG